MPDMPKYRFSMHTKFKLNPNIVIERFEDSGLLLHLPDLQLYELNPTALHVLEKTQAKHTLAQVAQSITEAFGVPNSQAIEDVIALYDQLLQKNIIEIYDELS